MGKKTEDKFIKAMRKAEKNLVDFRHIVLNCGDDEVAPAKFHFDWSDSLLNGTENEAKEGFRESAKSQYILRSYLQYVLTYPSKKRDYIVLIKANATLAQNKLKETENEYNENPVVKARCKEIKEQSGNVFSVNVENKEGEIINIRIEAYGKGASVRGLNNRDRRPKIIIIDDPQDLEDMKSETVMDGDWKWFLSDIKFLGQNSRIFMIGNNLGEKCILERIERNPLELGFKFERIPIEREGVSTWPAKYSLEFIQKEKDNFRRLGNLDIWLRERMCQSVSEETRIFSRDLFQHYVGETSARIGRDANRFACLDPAYSQSPTACYRAIVVKYVDYKNNWFIPDVRFGRWDTFETINQIFEVVVQHRLQEFGIEKGLYHSVMKPVIEQEMSKRNVFFTIIEMEHVKFGTKLQRVKALQPRFKAKTVYFPERASWLSEMESELLGVTKEGFKSLYVDLIDTLAMHLQKSEVPYSPDEDMDADPSLMPGDSVIPRGAVVPMETRI